MTDSDGDPDTSDVVTGAPVDFDRLALVRERLSTDDRFARVAERPEFAPERLVCVYDSRLSPGTVRAARLEVVWFENGDFSIHYHEDLEAGTIDHRWDRHPSEHNTRDHVHPGPDAPTPGADASHPDDWRDVLSLALKEIESRQRGFWVE
jgi:hypothetical protein